ncbi:MAG TPA: sialidase family protein [Tepidisphaeraceae bacterium]|nr:sialidase family protein [Tepidisphaeraceae bacterium]
MRTLCAALVLLTSVASAGEPPKVTAARCPDGGVQPQLAADDAGRLHLVYLKGPDASAVDVVYRRSDDAGRTWSAPLRVNSQPGAAIAAGTVRGAHLALGPAGRPHVAWMGSKDSSPKGPGDSTPLLYARLNDAGDAFEPQRNLITSHPGLDGGGSIAAGPDGAVYVAWHAPTPGLKGEGNRGVWVAVSKDHGKTFAPETAALKDATGVCGCCGMRVAVAADGKLVTLYRAANDRTRDIYVVASPGGEAGAGAQLSEFPAKTCPMSTAALVPTGDATLAAYEHAGDVVLAILRGGKANEQASPPGHAMGRKHPAVAVSKDGTILLTWDEGTGWKKGGTVKWQAFDKALKPIPNATGTGPIEPAWSLPAVAATKDGFVVLY